MKMRIQGNAIRFRLNRREVEQFASGLRISAAIEFPEGELRYTLTGSAGGGAGVEFSGGEIRVRIAQSQIRDWASGEDVAIQAGQPLESGQTLEILIEKDFQCMHKGEEGKDPDAFPNPLAAA